MEKVDLVIVGAEGVAESGGIINKVPMCVKHVKVICTHVHIKCRMMALYHDCVCQLDS